MRQREVRVSDRVRSYDFPGIREDSYVEGVVVRITDPEDPATPPQFRDCPHYEIRVERQVVQGAERRNLVGESVYPPVNGTPTWLGGTTSGVVPAPEV